MEDWLKAYYMEMDPLKRQQLLLENTKETKDGQDGLLRQLWEARYGKGKPRKDDFVGYLMNLRYIAESGKMDPGGRKKKLAVWDCMNSPKRQRMNRQSFCQNWKTPAENILISVHRDAALLLLSLEWDNYLMRVSQARLQMR